MKYTKTAAALALAGVATAPVAQAEPVVTLSGYVGINLESDDSDATDNDFSFSGDDSSLNISAVDDLTSGLEGYINYRLDGALTSAPIASDNVHVGIRGDFGDIRIGEVPDATEYGQLANDALDDVGGEDAGISYTNNFGPINFGANWSPEGASDRIAAGVSFNAAGFGIGIGVGNASSETLASLGATYALGAGSVGVAFKELGTHQSYGLNGSYSWGSLGLQLTWEQRLEDAATLDDSVFRIDLSYGLGGGWTVSGRFNQLFDGGTPTFTDVEDDAGVVSQVVDVEDLASYRVQFAKSF